VSRLRPQTLRVIGPGFLALTLLLIHPSDASADGKSPRQPAKRTVPNDRRGEAKTAASRSQGGRCVHVVKRGDSVSRLAARYRVTRDSIIAGNQLASPAALRVGQNIEVPGCDAMPPRRVASQDAPAIVAADDTALLARVGPRRIPTRLHVGTPDLGTDVIEFQWPTDGVVVSTFGRRRAGWHAGIDIKADLGAPIRAVAAGTVILSAWEPSYGRLIKIQHAGGFTSLYAHNLENLVDVGDAVEMGAVIATVGSSGRATAPHLHFEIRRAEVAYNPLHLLEMRQTPMLASASETALDDNQDRE
jgi:murein DD-endopeptidase MepM/ murein hydrolase activator NlpD